MIFNPITLLKELMSARGVSVRIISPPFDEKETFDEDLRAQIYQDFDYPLAMQNLIKHCAANTVHFITDQFELNYIIIKCPGPDDDSFVIVGPYLSRMVVDFFEEVLRENSTPLAFVPELKSYYYGIPCVTDHNAFKTEILTLTKYIFGTEKFTIDTFSVAFSKEDSAFKPMPDSTLSMAMIDERYRNEDALIKAIEQGDAKQAMAHLSAFSKFKVERRHADELRQLKNFLFVLNTLFRKAVQRADVHPAHIDNTSGNFARKIEAARVIPDLNDLSVEMIRKYCLLVKNHSLKGYSKNVQRAINHIDFHYTEAIKLTDLADIVAVNASYLSSQFKKETGASVVDYINQKRIQRSLSLLVTTELPIHQVAEQVGFLDENYFTRMFSRQIGKSPREYRKSFHVNQSNF